MQQVNTQRSTNNENHSQVPRKRTRPSHTTVRHEDVDMELTDESTPSNKPESQRKHYKRQRPETAQSEDVVMETVDGSTTSSEPESERERSRVPSHVPAVQNSGRSDQDFEKYLQMINAFGDNLEKYVDGFDSVLENDETFGQHCDKESFTPDERSAINRTLACFGENREECGRICRCIYSMYLCYDIGTKDDLPVDRDGKSENINRVLGLYGEDESKRNKIKKDIQFGKQMLKHVIKFGWQIIFWDGFTVYNIRQKKSKWLDKLWVHLDNNSIERDRLRHKLNSRIAEDVVKKKIITVLGNIFGNVTLAEVFFHKINSIDSSFLELM